MLFLPHFWEGSSTTTTSQWSTSWPLKIAAQVWRRCIICLALESFRRLESARFQLLPKRSYGKVKASKSKSYMISTTARPPKTLSTLVTSKMKTRCARSFVAPSRFASTGKTNGSVEISTLICFIIWTITHPYSVCKSWARKHTPKTFMFSQKVSSNNNFQPLHFRWTGLFRTCEHDRFRFWLSPLGD